MLLCTGMPSLFPRHPGASAAQFELLEEDCSSWYLKLSWTLVIAMTQDPGTIAESGGMQEFYVRLVM